jgi:hypothetical protein
MGTAPPRPQRARLTSSMTAVRPSHNHSRAGNLDRARVGVRSVFVIMLLTAFGCSTHTTPRTINVSVSLVRGETQFVPGRVTASLPDGTVVASARQSGRPGENVNFTVRTDRTYTFRGYADDGTRCGPSTSSAPKTPPGIGVAWTVAVRCS